MCYSERVTCILRARSIGRVTGTPEAGDVHVIFTEIAVSLIFLYIIHIVYTI